MTQFRLTSMPGLAMLALFTAAPVWAQAPKTTGIESLLPGNTVAYAHFRVSEIAKSDQLSFMRKVAGYVGLETMFHYDRRFGHLPSKVETVTLIWPSERCTPNFPSGYPDQRTVVWVLTTKEPIDRLNLMQSLLSKAVTKKHHRHEYFFDERTWSGFMFVDANTVAYASEDSLMDLLDLQADSKEEGVLAGFLRQESGKHAFHTAIDPATFQKPEMLRHIAKEYWPLVRAKTWSVSLNLTGETRLAGKMIFHNADQAKEGEASVKAGLNETRVKLEEYVKLAETEFKNAPAGLPGDFFETSFKLAGIGSAKYVMDILKTLPVEMKGTTLEAQVNIDARFPHAAEGLQTIYVLASEFFLAGRGYSEKKYALEDSVRRQSNIAQTMERYHKEHGRYPAPSINDASGKPLLSWRVAILPYLNQFGNGAGPYKSLYDQFKLNEPWDGPNNRKLIGRMPYEFRATYDGWRQGPRTGCQLVTGKDTLFQGKEGFSKMNIPERKEFAVLLVQVDNPDAQVLWSKPEDIAYDAKKPLPSLMHPKEPDGLLIYTLDGNFRYLPAKFSEENFRSLFEFHARKGLKDVPWKEYIRNDGRPRVEVAPPNLN